MSSFTKTDAETARFADDSVSSVIYPKVKLAFGIDGTATDVSTSTRLPVDGSGVTQPVSLASVPSHAVTNAGTFATQATLAAETTKVIGTVNVSAAQSIAATQSGTWSFRLQDGSGNAITSATRGAERAATVQIVDGTGTQITSFGGTGATATDAAAFTRGVSSISPVAMVETAAPTLTTGKVSALSMDTGGGLRVTIVGGGITSGTAGSASADVITVQGKSGMTAVVVDGSAATQPVSNAGTFAVQAAPTAATTGGASVNTLVAPATPAKNSVKTSAGTVYGFTAFNILATPVYLKVFDVANGSITLGTTAATYQFMIPGNTAGAGFHVALPTGIAHATAIQTAVTAGISLTDNTSTSATSIVVNLYYK